MHKTLTLLSCFIFVLGLAGCQRQLGKSFGAGQAVLPPDIAGTWRAYGSSWKIVLSPDGTVSSAFIPMGGVGVRPNQTSEIHGSKEEPGIFEAGDFKAYYEPENRDLSVSIKIKHIYMDMGSILEGTCDYFIAGSVSEDGKVWYADVFTALDLTVLAPEPNSTTEEQMFEEIGVLKSSFSDGSERLRFIKAEDSGNKK